MAATGFMGSSHCRKTIIRDTKVWVVLTISSSVGPRKLAKVLLTSFKRWTRLQAGRTPTQSPVLGAEARPPRLPATVNVSTVIAPTGISSSPTTNGGNPTDSLSEPQTEGESPRTQPVFQLPPLDIPPLHLPEASTPASLPLPLPTPSPQFLLVEDNPINLRILCFYMKQLGLAYDTAADGLQALHAFRDGAGQYTCIFMDISMPVMDGFESTRRIRALEAERRLPRCSVIALTGLASADAQLEAFASGIDLFLTKPVRLKELSQILARRSITST